MPAVLEACAIHGMAIDFERILSRNQAPAVGYFGMPAEHVIELGMQLER